MAKAATPGTIEIPGIGGFSANAVPDPFDARDLEYRPKLAVLPREVDSRRTRHVYLQSGQSCTGHALAAVINHVLRATNARTRVSPYMLYRLARRYDEFPGDADAGSSLRGAFKGWFHHGAAPEQAWPALDMSPEPDPDDLDNLNAWRERPLGAFYRVNPFRLDDVQSAITELSAIAVSSVIHDGWKAPVRHTRGRSEMYVIAKTENAEVLGGHAYCIVGYNEVGFLVQNSWGTDWGDGGFATLPYDDWLDSAYDAWVARPGVPQTPFYAGRSRTVPGTGGELATGPGPDLRRLALHVVNTGNDGALSSSGKFVSTPAQLDRIVGHMDAWHRYFLAKQRIDRRHVLLWAHGGGVAETSGLAIAERHLNWWLNLGVFPVTFVWETGVLETLSSAVEDLVRDVIPFGGIGFDLVEQLDRLVEGECRKRLRWAWAEIKENAGRASDVAPDGTRGGAALLVDRLVTYADLHGRDNVRIHLAGHSAGSIYQAAMLERLSQAGLAVDTLTWLAPAITVDRFRQRVLPHLGVGATVQRFTCVNLRDNLELDDSVGPIYHKSAVYLVARGFEDALGPAVSEVPLLGLTKYWDATAPGATTLAEEVRARGGQLVVARSAAPPDARSDASHHTDFDEDAPTMTSVAMRVLGAKDHPERYAYRPYADLLDPGGVPWSPALGAVAVAAAPPVGPGRAAPVPMGTAREEPAGAVAAEPAAAGPAAEPTATAGPEPPERSASPTIEILAADGWRAD